MGLLSIVKGAVGGIVKGARALLDTLGKAVSDLGKRLSKDKKVCSPTQPCPEPAPTTYGKAIRIDGDAAFRERTKQALDELKKTTTGKAVLKSLDDSGKQVTVKWFGENNGRHEALSDTADLKSDGTSGEGSGSVIYFNPDFKPGGLSSSLVLGHELIHAQHSAYGALETGKTAEGVQLEEHKTIGLPPFPESGLTENSLRKDMGIEKRTKY